MIDPHPHAWLDNNLLRSLQSTDFALLKPALHPWHGEAGTVIYEPGDDVRYAYFPCGPSMVAFMIMLRDGREVETALIGREGAAGGIVSNGNLPAFARLTVLASGQFMRMETTALEQAKQNSLALSHMFSRYADCLLAQVFQSVACNAVHSIEQRTARWILAAIERSGNHDIPMTQERLSGMLGVGRSYVNRVLKVLKADGVLDTRRGGLHVRNVQALQSVACECAATVREHFEEVLDGVYTKPDLEKLRR